MASDGLVVHGPARGFVGQLLLTGHGGQTWQQVRF
jgi:hypothetical protein